jgi:hypothetical protein
MVGISDVRRLRAIITTTRIGTTITIIIMVGASRRRQSVRRQSCAIS